MPSPLSRFKRIPEPQGATAEQQSTVYNTFYGEMPVPATQYASTVTALADIEVQPSVVPVWMAPYVNRANDRTGMISTGGIQQRTSPPPQIMDPVDSSKFQEQLIGPHVNYDINTAWYIAYPAASVMLGGMRNQGLSQKIPQLPTRTTGGPGPGSMRQAPRFKAVQTVPRYSTMPPTYPTASAQG